MTVETYAALGTEVLQYLTRQPWRAQFDAATMRRAHALLQGVELVDLRRIDNETLLQFDVISSRGDDAYELDVAINHRSNAITLDCNCPVGHRCKHAAAALTWISTAEGMARQVKQLERLLGPSPAVPGGPDVALAARPERSTTPTHAPILAEQQARDAAQQNVSAWRNWLRSQQPRPSFFPDVNPKRPSTRMQFRFALVPKGLRVRFSIEFPDWATANGNPRPPKKVRPFLYSRLDTTELDGNRVDLGDVAILERLLPFVPPYGIPEALTLAGPGADDLMRRLLTNHHCVIDGTQTALRLGPVREPVLLWQDLPNGKRRLQMDIATQANLLNLGELWYFDQTDAAMGPVNTLTYAHWQAMAQSPDLERAAAGEISQLLATLSWPVPIPMATTKPMRTIGGPPAAHLFLQIGHSARSTEQREWYATMRFQYGEHWVLDDSCAQTMIEDDNLDDFVVVNRERGAEYRFRSAVYELGGEPPSIPPGLAKVDPRSEITIWQVRSKTATSMAISADHWLSLSAQLARRGITLHVPEHPSIQTIDAGQEALQLEVLDSDGKPGWFSVELGVDVDGQRVSLLPILARGLDLPSLMLPAADIEVPDAVVHVRVDERRHLRIPLADVRRYLAPLTEWLEHLDQRGLQLPITRSDVIAEYLSASLALRAPESLARLGRALRGEWKPLRAPAPEGLQATLRDYQWAGVQWLDFLAEYGLGGILADDMGLGKTMQVLAHILAERHKQRTRGCTMRPCLIVMPTSLVPNWQAEAARFAPSLRVLTLHGGDRHGQFDAIVDHDLVLTTYALLYRDIETLQRHHFALVVFDEAQALRNARTRGALAARELRADRCLAMTGTPIENHLGELWAQTDLVLPGLFGTARDFATRYRNPIEKQQDQARKEQLHARLRPFVLRRNKSEVAKELPAKTLITRRIAIEGKQRDLYESLRLAMHKKVRQAIGKRGLNASSIIILDALLKLRQVCCDSGLVKLPEAKKVGISAKREYFQDMLQELLQEGRKILVFSQFTEMLDLLEADLEQAAITYTRLDGSTKDRAVPVQSFQSGSVPVMLISLKAGGTGLNLTAADTVIHYDPWWNPAVMRQAEDRAHRIGQDKPVFVYSLVCEDTVEDRILELQSRKAELAKAILEGGSVDAMSLDEATLNALFAPA